MISPPKEREIIQSLRELCKLRSDTNLDAREALFVHPQ